MKKYIYAPVYRGFCAVACLVGALASTAMLTSCEDFFEQDSSYVIYEGDNPLNSATDTVYSVIGIMGKLQEIADRTILLGEVRGDLMDINENTATDLREMALFTMDDDNVYNQPRDYYAIINNCNYYLAKVDTAIRNNRNEQMFLPEYAAVKGFRAWTYLQLVLNYGSVPFVTEPILTQEQADATYDRYNIQQVCEYFIKDLQGLEDVEYPGYGEIRQIDSRLLYFPIRILLGDLNLWAGNYKEAALNYYGYISHRNGDNSAYGTGSNYANWSSSDWTYPSAMSSFSESYSSYGEVITIIPGDSIPSEGVYSQLRNLFNSFGSDADASSNIFVSSSILNEGNNGKVSLVPSTGLKELSASQVYCYVEAIGNNQKDTLYAPAQIHSRENCSGDLRLYSWWGRGNRQTVIDNVQTEGQYIYKYTSRNVRIYRRIMVYLRMAEALNRAGYPHMAYQILSTGLTNEIIDERVKPHYSSVEDLAFISQFDFPNNRYAAYYMSEYVGQQGLTFSGDLQVGIHSRGCGYSDANEYYQMPMPETALETRADTLAYQMEKVEDMIVDEGALEFAFEGTRYYDLMRVALRRGDANYLADRVYGRKGKDNVASMKSEIGVDLTDMTNWYLNWGGQIGMK